MDWASARKFLDEQRKAEERRRQQEMETLRQRRDRFVNADELTVNDNVVGRMSDLPQWAQDAIRDLRERLYVWEALD